jgi:DNA-binding MarR family transcriptional regulator
MNFLTETVYGSGRPARLTAFSIAGMKDYSGGRPTDGVDWHVQVRVRDADSLRLESMSMARKRQTSSKRPEQATAANGGVALVSPLRGSPTFLVRLAQLSAFDEFHRQYAGFGFTPARFAVLALIVANPGVRPGALAEELRVKPSNVAALVNALAGDGFVERRQDASELRANKLYPTRAGVNVYDDMWALHQYLDELFLAPLTASERKEFIKLIRKLDHA